MSANQNRPIKTIWVFRTSVLTSLDIRKLKSLLDAIMEKGDKWNFDLEDCDHILRVETLNRTASDIIYTLVEAGYTCSELEDSSDSILFDKKRIMTYLSEMKVNAG